MTRGNDLTFPNAGISRRSCPLFCLGGKKFLQSDSMVGRFRMRNNQFAKLYRGVSRAWMASVGANFVRKFCEFITNRIRHPFPLPGEFCFSIREFKLFRRNRLVYRVEKSTQCWPIASCERFSVIKLTIAKLLKYVLIQWLKLQLFDKYILFLYKYIFCVKNGY